MGLFPILQYGDKNPVGFFEFLKLLISARIIIKYIQWTYNFTIIIKLYLYFNIYYISRGNYFPHAIFSIWPDEKESLWNFIFFLT